MYVVENKSEGFSNLKMDYFKNIPDYFKSQQCWYPLLNKLNWVLNETLKYALLSLQERFLLICCCFGAAE